MRWSELPVFSRATQFGGQASCAPRGWTAPPPRSQPSGRQELQACNRVYGPCNELLRCDLMHPSVVRFVHRSVRLCFQLDLPGPKKWHGIGRSRLLLQQFNARAPRWAIARKCHPPRLKSGQIGSLPTSGPCWATQPKNALREGLLSKCPSLSILRDASELPALLCQTAISAGCRSVPELPAAPQKCRNIQLVGLRLLSRGGADAGVQPRFAGS